MNFASCSSTRFAFGPGSAVTSRGVFISNVVGISSSIEEAKVEVNQERRPAAGALKRQAGNGLQQNEHLTKPTPQRSGRRVAGGRKPQAHAVRICGVHLQFRSLRRS